MRREDLVSLVLALTDAAKCRVCAAGLVVQGEEAIPVLLSALDYASFCRAHGQTVLTDDQLSLGSERVRNILVAVGDVAKLRLLEHMDSDNNSIRYGSAYCLALQGHGTAQALLRDGLERGLLDARLNDAALAVLAPPSIPKSDARRIARAVALAERRRKASHDKRFLNWTARAGIPLTKNSLRQRIEDLEAQALETEVVRSKIESMSIYLEAVHNRKVKGFRKTSQLATRYWQPVIDSLPDSSLGSIPGLALNYLVEIWVDFKGATGKRSVSRDFLDEIGKITRRLERETTARERELEALRSIPARTRKLTARQLSTIICQSALIHKSGHVSLSDPLFCPSRNRNLPSSELAIA